MKKNINITKLKTLEEVKDRIKNFRWQDDSDGILEQSKIEWNKIKDGEPLNDVLCKAISLNEFQNGILLINTMPDQYRTFAIDLLRKLQNEFNCVTPSEQATAELVIVNFIRTLEIQKRIYRCLEVEGITDLKLKFIAIMSKELDRANRHYLTAIQTLRMMKQPSLRVSIKTNTAIVGNNQLIQENQNVNPK